MTYQDVVDKWHRQQHPNESQRRWEEQQHEEDRAREIVAQYLREHKYVDCRPTSEQIAAIDVGHKLAGTKPAWTAILRAANERAARACALEYRDEAKRAEQAAEEQGD